MTPREHWGLVTALFERALEENPADIRAWLDAQGVTDERVREEVLSLLRHHSVAGSFLVEPVANRMPELLEVERVLQPGQRVGKYSIVRELGRGGMGRVYLARQVDLDRDVALKALAPDLARNPLHRERLRREARAAAALRHEGVCTVYALEEIDEDLYIAAEFVDGRTLHDEIRAGRRPSPASVEATARSLAAALACAHERGITHRDLKPENVMRTSDGRLKILDFGLARLDASSRAADAYLTQPGTIMGTPAYMAPEQLNGQPADTRTDVFALGVLLYEFATGRHPFEADTPLAMMGRILQSEATPIESLRSDLPAALPDIIRRCLAKAPADRFPSATELLRVLDGVRPAPAAVGGAGWWRLHQMTVIALYFVACALAWQVKEWRPGLPTALFFAIGISATVGGFVRGHLLFIERVTGVGLDDERQRMSPVSLAADLAVGLALAADGALLASERPLPAILTVALGVGLALVRVVIEPATTAAAFRRPTAG